MFRPRIVWLLAVLSFPVPLAAATLTFDLDPKATTIHFTFGATMHTVTGSLRAESGAVQIDPETSKAGGWIVIDATSAKTGNSRRDFKMHEKILESRRYPDLVFTVERISGTLHRTGRSDVQLHGHLQMHGVSRPLALPAEVLVEGDNVRATAYLTVPYLEWGLRDPSFLFLRVAKEVRVVIKAAGHLTG